MDKNIIIVLVIFFLGIYCLGRGMTGLVVSESCCFPPDCAPENQCVTEEFSTPWISYLFLLFGIVIVGVALIAVFWSGHKS